MEPLVGNISHTSNTKEVWLEVDAEQEMTDRTKELPEEVLDRIFKMLSLQELKTAVMVCRRWRLVGERSGLWKSCCVILSRKNHSVSKILRMKRLQEARTLIVKRMSMSSLTLNYIFSRLCSNNQFKTVSISDNNLSSVKPRLLQGTIINLETLNVENTNLTPKQTETIFTSVSEGGSTLQHLNISYNNLSRLSVVLSARAVSRLATLDVSYTALTPDQAVTILTAVSEGYTLTKLYLGGNDLSLVEPVLLAHVVTKLESLDVRHTDLITKQVETVLGAICQGSRMRNLDISGNVLSGVDPEIVARAVSRLESVSLEDTSLSKEHICQTLTLSLTSTALVSLRLGHVSCLCHVLCVGRDLATQVRGKYKLWLY